MFLPTSWIALQSSQKLILSSQHSQYSPSTPSSVISSGISGNSLTIALGGGSGSNFGVVAGVLGVDSAERAAGVGLSEGLGNSPTGGNDCTAGWTAIDRRGGLERSELVAC